MKRLLLILSLITLSLPTFAWGPKGHDVVAYVAECHLSKRAAAQLDELLGGYSPVYWANWLDNASNTPQYRYTKTWHYMNIDEGKDIETMEREPKGDLLTALEGIIAGLKSHKLSRENESLYVKMLIHLIGDLHCPMHAGRKTDLGGNRIKVRYFGKESKLHSVWDSSIVESAHRWGYSEWQQQCDRLSKEEAERVCQGSITDWFRETVEICRDVYASSPEGSNLSYDYVAKYSPVVEQQLVRGGHRLAAILNEIYK
ncbi:MAG: S1/P1 nuclease [Alistipes sp.]|nr:S1/P1 nuclease [Alistipes sp.]